MLAMTGDIIWPQGWRVEVGDLPGRLHGLTLYRERRSIIREGLHPWQHKATAVHESIHAHDGPVPRWLESREERRVNRETARRLIPLDALIHAMQGTRDARTAAEWLEMPVALVWARIQGLHPAERHAVLRALRAAEAA